jgi:hypothetical protein
MPRYRTRLRYDSGMWIENKILGEAATLEREWNRISLIASFTYLVSNHEHAQASSLSVIKGIWVSTLDTKGEKREERVVGTVC